MGDDLQLIAVGFFVVMSVLTALWAICSCIGLVFKSVENRHGREKPPAASKGPRDNPNIAAIPGATPVLTEPKGAEGLPPHHLAAITAAVAVSLGRQPHRIVTVSAPAHSNEAWAQEGRMEQFSSHRVRWRWDIARLPFSKSNESNAR